MSKEPTSHFLPTLNLRAPLNLFNTPRVYRGSSRGVGALGNTQELSMVKYLLWLLHSPFHSPFSDRRDTFSLGCSLLLIIITQPKAFTNILGHIGHVIRFTSEHVSTHTPPAATNSTQSNRIRLLPVPHCTSRQCALSVETIL